MTDSATPAEATDKGMKRDQKDEETSPDDGGPAKSEKTEEEHVQDNNHQPGTMNLLADAAFKARAASITSTTSSSTCTNEQQKKSAGATSGADDTQTSFDIQIEPATTTPSAPVVPKESESTKAEEKDTAPVETKDEKVLTETAGEETSAVECETATTSATEPKAKEPIQKKEEGQSEGDAPTEKSVPSKKRSTSGDDDIPSKEQDDDADPPSKKPRVEEADSSTQKDETIKIDKVEQGNVTPAEAAVEAEKETSMETEETSTEGTKAATGEASVAEQTTTDKKADEATESGPDKMTDKTTPNESEDSSKEPKVEPTEDGRPSESVENGTSAQPSKDPSTSETGTAIDMDVDTENSEDASSPQEDTSKANSSVAPPADDNESTSPTAEEPSDGTPKSEEKNEVEEDNSVRNNDDIVTSEEMSTDKESDNRDEANVEIPLSDKDGKDSSVEISVSGAEDNNNGGNKKRKKRKGDPVVFETRRRIQMCCKDNDLATAMEAYEEAIQKGTLVEASTYYSLMNLCDGLERRSHVGRPNLKDNTIEPDVVVREVDLKTRQEYVFRLKEAMTTNDFPLNETSYTAVVKILARNKEFEKAEVLLAEAEGVQQCRPKLRLYSSLLAAYCEERQMVNTLKCWLKMVTQGLAPTEKEFLALLRCAVYTGDVAVMEWTLTAIADEVAVPCKASVAYILAWFVSAHALHPQNIVPMHADESEVSSLLRTIDGKRVDPSPAMGPVVNRGGWEVSSSVAIDASNGSILDGCLKGLSLGPVPLSKRAWEEMKTKNETIVLKGEVEGSASKFAGGRKGKKNMKFNAEERSRNWQNFQKFLDKNGPFDVVVDGANVGYCDTNFAGAPTHVDYNQINWIIEELTRQEKRVLLVLHQRHFSKKLLPDSAKPIIDQWDKSNIIYRTPAGMNDDWFWMHAALQDKALVLTNDEMRDHHFQMLAPRDFLRWKEKQQIHFGLGEWTTDKDTGKRRRSVELKYPSPYSRRVQRVQDGLVIPLAKRGDENRFLDGFQSAQEDEPEDETYVCLRPVASGKEDTPVDIPVVLEE